MAHKINPPMPGLLKFASAPDQRGTSRTTTWLMLMTPHQLRAAPRLFSCWRCCCRGGGGLCAPAAATAAAVTAAAAAAAKNVRLALGQAAAAAALVGHNLKAVRWTPTSQRLGGAGAPVPLDHKHRHGPPRPSRTDRTPDDGGRLTNRQKHTASVPLSWSPSMHNLRRQNLSRGRPGRKEHTRKRRRPRPRLNQVPGALSALKPPAR